MFTQIDKTQYIARRKSDVVLLKQALEEGNLIPFQTIGHQLKGNGATFGHPEISELGSMMEDAAVENQAEELRRLLKILEEWTLSPH